MGKETETLSSRTCLVTQLSSRDLIAGLLDSKTQSINQHAALCPSDHIDGCREGNGDRGMVSGLAVLHLLFHCPQSLEIHVPQTRVYSHPSIDRIIYWTSAEYSGPDEKIQISHFSPTIRKYLSLPHNLQIFNYKTCH